MTTGMGPQQAPISYADPTTPRAEHQSGAGLTRRDAAALAVKLMGVYLIVQTIPILVDLGAWALEGVRMRPVLGYYLVRLGFFAGLGLVLIATGDRVGVWLLPEPTAMPSPPASIEARDLQAAAFAFVGVLMVAAWALPGLIYDGWLYYYGNAASDNLQRMPNVGALIARHVLELLLGIWLFYGSKRLSGYWQRVRSERPMSEHDERPL